jgi:LysM repeat protein
MVALQHTAGNAAVNRLLRDLAPPVLGTDQELGAGPVARLVADDASETKDGQMRVSDFAAQLKSSLCAIADSMLGPQANGCPWVEYWVSSYRSRTPAEIERVLGAYAPEAAGARSATELIAAVGDRVRSAIATWQQTGQLDPAASAGAPQVSFKRRGGVVSREAQAAEVLNQLGPGRPLEALTAGRMGSALGADFGAVQVHDDPTSAATTSALGATALAVGHHIAFAPNQYAPGTPIGDALIAHELAHVVQQQDAAARLDRAVDDDAVLEADADAAAASALDVLHGGPAGRRGLRRAARSGLRLQRCSTKPDKTTAAGPDILAGTHTATQAQHAAIEAIFHPGSTVTVAPPTPVGVPAPPPVVTGPPPMTGAGVGGAFETALVTALDHYVDQGSADFLAASAGGETFPLADAKGIARAAQAEVESRFRDYIDAASRKPSDVYHPGTYDVASQLASVASYAQDNHWWADYWAHTMDNGKILKDHHVATPRDDAEYERVLQVFLNKPGNAAKIANTVHGWPALTAGNTVYIQTYQDMSDADKARRVRWDLFTTLIHETIHKLEHPNFATTEEALGGDAQMQLREGFCDLMRHDVWDSGAGNLKERIKTDDALRSKVEGAAFPYKEDVVVYHNDYDELADARKIRDQVGMANCKAAFFLGHTELLGIGHGTALPPGRSLVGVADWDPTEADNPEIYLTVAGDTIAKIGLKCGVEESTITKPDGSAVGPGDPAPGTRLKVAGIRYVHAVDGDTLASIARQNGVTESSVAFANGLAVGAPVAAGRRILIPHRR